MEMILCAGNADLGMNAWEIGPPFSMWDEAQTWSAGEVGNHDYSDDHREHKGAE